MMFDRIARNFVKNGYFPTDDGTIAGICRLLQANDEVCLRIFDPCAGEGTALLQLSNHLGRDRCVTHGIEYDAQRAYAAKSVLDLCIHGDFNDCVVGQSQYGLLLLNPPYGDLVSDKAQTAEVQTKGRKRLEKVFYRRSVGLLQIGGVMILIIPHYTLDQEFSRWISSHFTKVRVYRAVDTQFQQIVIFGERCRSGAAADEVATRRKLQSIGEGNLEDVPVIGAQESSVPYLVPAVRANHSPRIYSIHLDPRQLAEELTKPKVVSLWPQFNGYFGRVGTAHRRPLAPLSQWHLALALAAGQVSGSLHSEDGRCFVIKGDTFKEKVRTVEHEGEPGEGSTTTVLKDKFVPVIKAWDFTPHSERFGEVVTIR